MSNDHVADPFRALLEDWQPDYPTERELGNAPILGTKYEGGKTYCIVAVRGRIWNIPEERMP